MLSKVRQSPDLGIMLCKLEPVPRLNSCPHIANVLLQLLVAPAHPRGIVQQGRHCHEGVIGLHHTSHNAKRQHIYVVGNVPTLTAWQVKAALTRQGTMPRGSTAIRMEMYLY